MRLAVPGVALMLALGCATPTRVAERADVIREIRASTVQLRAERDGGARRAASGVVVAVDPGGGRSWILTVKHLVHPAVPQQVSVRALGHPGRRPATIKAVAKESDLALVEVQGLVLAPVRLKLAVQLGDDVWVAAFPWGRRQTIVSGVVSQLVGEEGDPAFEGSARMVDASASYGSSGGGIFEAGQGRLVGIVEGYRTARVTLPETVNRTLEVPVPGETTVISSEIILRFLVASGLEAFLAR